jgi:hypothetical protein
MKNLFAVLGSAFALASISTVAHAQAYHNEVYGAVGTEGIGAGYGYGINDHFGVRAEVDGFGVSHSFSAGDLDYDGTLRLTHGALLADFFPVPQSYVPVRLTAGILVGDDQLSGDATSMNGTYTLNGATVSANGESINVKLKFPTVRPYVGLGFGHNPTAKKGFSMACDAGVAIGKPSVSFNVPSDIEGVAGAENVAAEEQNLQSKANKFSVYPIVKIAATYRF